MYTYTLDIIDTAYEGYGVGKISGKAVFVPFTVQGDNVSIEIIEDKKKYSFGKLLKINKASEHRGERYCRYIGECGGCLFGHIKHASQIEIKKQIIENAFRNFENFKINNVIPDKPLEYRFRTNMKIKDGEIGFFRNKSHEIIPLDKCPIMKPSLMDKVKKLKKYTDQIKSGNIYMIENEEEKSLLKTDFNIDEKESDEMLKIFNGISTPTKRYGISKIPVKTLYGTFYTGFEGFSQSNRFLLNDFQKTIANLTPENSRVLELYAGSGFLTLAAAQKAEKINAYEISKESVSLAKEAKISKAHFHRENVDKNIFRIQVDFDTILVNPGRNGMGKQASEFIKTKRPQTFIYASCNPLTMSRDIHRLSEFYNIDEFILLDMFPGTFHMECIAKMSKK